MICMLVLLSIAREVVSTLPLIVDGGVDQHQREDEHSGAQNMYARLECGAAD